MSGERLGSDVSFDDKGDEKSNSSKESSTFCSDDSTIDWSNSPQPSISSLPVASTSTSSPSPVKDQSESFRHRIIAREVRKRRTNEKLKQIKEEWKRRETKSQIKKCLLKYGYLLMGASLVIGIGFYLYKYYFSIVSPPANIEKLIINP